jgi:Holliday junction resolvase RusA-like endonuclease
MQHRFWLDVTPRAAARTRATCRGKFAQVYTDPGYRKWLEGDEETGAPGALARLRERVPALPEDVRKRPIRVTIEVLVRKPKSTKRQQPGGDNDNYEKGIWDAMTKVGGWWIDDTQIVENRTIKRWAEENQPDGYQITVEFLETP